MHLVSLVAPGSSRSCLLFIYGSPTLGGETKTKEVKRLASVQALGKPAAFCKHNTFILPLGLPTCALSYQGRLPNHVPISFLHPKVKEF